MAANRRQRRAEAKRAAASAGSGNDATVVLAAAGEQLAQGRFADADRMVSRVLAVYPKNAEAYHLRAVIAYQTGHAQAALDLLAKAVKYAPRSGSILGTLAVIHDSLGNAELAEKTYRKALAFAPDDSQIHNNYGGFLKAAGQLPEAEHHFRQAVAASGDDVASLSNLGALLAETGRLEESENLFKTAIAKAPDIADLQTDLAVVLHQQDRLDDARLCLETVLQREPENHAALINLASVHFDAESFEAGEPVARKATEVAPDNAVAQNNLGNILTALGRYAEAEAAFERAAKAAPQDAGTQANLGHLLKVMGRGEDAVAAYRRALTLNPQGSQQAYGLSLALLMTGDLQEAWRYHEAGFACGERRPDRRAEAPRWTGEALDGKTLLVWPEQGVGDEVRFAGCFAEFLAKVPESAEIRIECDARLVPTFARSFPRATVGATGTSDPAAVDLQISAGQLTELLRPNLDAFPHDAGFLTPDPALLEKWRGRLDALGPAKKIGLTWTSGMKSGRRDINLTRLEEWRSLFDLSGVEIVSLQYGDVQDEIAAFEDETGAVLRRWPDLDLKDDLDDIFALCASLDAVVCIATSTADFAGCVGTPTHTVLNEGDWVTLGTDHHPWYPSLRLYSRRHDQNWSNSIKAIVQDLNAAAGT